MIIFGLKTAGPPPIVPTNKYTDAIREEIYLRVVMNLEMPGHIDDLRRLSHTDYLTQLYNRRFFFEIGDKLFENVRRNNLCIGAAVIMEKTLEETVGRADGLMYDTKTGGRNRAVAG
ncbi:MAG: hypothetical protein JXD23_06380 [Spirochaetales bacterium]|nr:hypothetical protein [Spirochaetales bacterium]